VVKLPNLRKMNSYIKDMKLSTHEIAIAGLLHDIGKLFQRANWGEKKPHTMWTHSAVIGLANLWERYGIDPNTLAHAAAYHHQSKPQGWQPQTAADWAIALADNYASNEREELEGESKSGPPHRVPLTPIFNRIQSSNSASRAPDTAYNLIPLDQELSAFPASDVKLTYTSLTDRLSLRFKEIANNPPQDVGALLSNLNAVLYESTWAVPSDTVGEPDVSLYDHLRLTAAFAAALWNYHSETDGQTTIDRLKQEDESKFLLVSGDISGIQNHIYRIRQTAATGVGGIAKRLRARSLEVALATEAFAHQTLEALSLPLTNRILSAGGRFTLVAQNTPAARERLEQLKRTWQEWALMRGGTLIPILAWTSLSPAQLKSQPFKNFLSKLALELAAAKMQAFAGAGAELLPFASNGQSLRPCPVCDAQPSSGLNANGAWEPCERCQDEARIGQKLPSIGHIGLTDAPANGPYFPFPGVSAVPDHSGHFLYRSRLNFKPDESGFEVRPLTGRIPAVRDAVELLGDQDYSEWLIKKGLDDTLKELGVNSERPLTFEEIAHFSKGTPHLAALMLDADRMGEVFTRGFKDELQTPSRIGSLSRMLEFFFGFVATDLMKSPENYHNLLPKPLTPGVRERYRLIYSVYAGGDDVFVIGPWDALLSYALDLQRLYREYTNHHPAFTLSGGFVLIKPHTPVPLISDRAQTAEKAAKNAGRDRLTLFGHAIPWSEVERLLHHGQQFFELTSDGVFPRGLGHRLLGLWSLFDLWRKEQNPRGLKYKPLLYYQKRNEGVDKHWEELFEPLMNQLDPRMQHLPVWVQYAMYQGRKE